VNIFSGVRVTLDLPDALVAEARRVARARGTTLRDLTVQALSALLDQGEPRTPFRLRDASFGKQGLVKGLSETDWDKIRELSYDGRGG
jgi:hypothetical protein